MTSTLDIQRRLAALGFSPGRPLDGIPGPMTRAAIKAFQKARGLALDGIVGPITTPRPCLAPKAPLRPPCRGWTLPGTISGCTRSRMHGSSTRAEARRVADPVVRRLCGNVSHRRATG